MEILYGNCQCGCGQKTPLASENCKKRNWIKGEPIKFINYHNLILRHKNKTNRRWKKALGHPNGGKRQSVREYILIAEKALGKHLPQDAQIHHHTETQLVICQDFSYHLLLHRRMRAYMGCGYTNWRKCPHCKKWEPEKHLYISPTKYTSYHLACRVNYNRELRKRRNHFC